MMVFALLLKLQSFPQITDLIALILWIGTNVTILDGVTIHRGSVVGGGAVVTKDIPAYSVAVGVPAKVIKRRIEDKI